MAEKLLVLVTTDTGCIVPTSHALNQDGYFRKCVNGKDVMYHRYCWSLVHGIINKGHEIDHKCKNRACCNVEHLQSLPATEHRSKDNKERSMPRREEAYQHWLLHNNTGMSLAGLFDVGVSTACRWIREWKVLK